MEKIMDAALKSQIIDKIEQLPEGRLCEVLAYLELILAKTSLERANSNEPVTLPIEASWSSSFYYDDVQEIHTLEGGIPIVWEWKPIRAISKRQLVQYLNELVALAKTITPDVEAEVNIPGVEGQHAWMKMYVREEFEEQIDDLICERVHDIFMETGYDIGAIVYDKS
jgi:hypothetical protein